MTPASFWLQASFHAGRAWLQPSRATRKLDAALPPALVPIRSLGPRHRGRIAAHLRGLGAPDRYLRFGYPASDEQIERYVAGLDFRRDDIFGIFNRGLEMIAMAHLAYPREPVPAVAPLAASAAGLPGGSAPSPKPDSSMAEFGVSVVAHARGRGYGARLFERAVVHARNAGVGHLMIYALTQNAAMLHIARKAGARVQREGSESEAYLALPAASLESRISQLLAGRVGEVDYRLKVQAKRFWDVIGDAQEIRRGVRESRHRSGQ